MRATARFNEPFRLWDLFLLPVGESFAQSPLLDLLEELVKLLHVAPDALRDFLIERCKG